jgi:hypothetical protein
MQLSHKRSSVPLLVALTALSVVVLGGSAGAASKIGTNQIKNGAVTTKKLHNGAVTTKKIKNNAVNGAKVKDNSLTGNDINESTLGVVPNATNAQNATNAETAANGARNFKFFAPTGGPAVTANILSVAGATFQGACSAGNTVSGQVLGSAPGQGIIKSWGVNESQTAFNNSDDNLQPGDTFNYLDGANPETGGNLAFTGPGGNTTVTATFASEDDGALAPGADCMIWGTANVL